MLGFVILFKFVFFSGALVKHLLGDYVLIFLLKLLKQIQVLRSDKDGKFGQQ